jgi:hypothetical protein
MLKKDGDNQVDQKDSLDQTKKNIDNKVLLNVDVFFVMT